MNKENFENLKCRRNKSLVVMINGDGTMKSHLRKVGTKKVTAGITSLCSYSMAQQPLKSFDRPLMRVSLSNSILVTLIFYLSV